MNPLVLKGMDDPGEETFWGGGTGQGSTDPMSFDDWFEFGEDLDGDGDIDFDDYSEWWIGMDFGEDLWKEFNPDTPYPAP